MDGGNVVALRRRTEAEPFRSASAAWFWTMRMLLARQDGAGAAFGAGGARVCEPDDVVKCLDRLYRQRRISLQHAKVLREWGERGCAPTDPRSHDSRMWKEAMAALDMPLRNRGIVA